jgi:hypothetical protein
VIGLAELAVEVAGFIKEAADLLGQASFGTITPDAAHAAIGELHKSIVDKRSKRDAELAAKFPEPK